MSRRSSLASVVPALTAGIEAVAARRDRPLLVATAATVPIPIRVDRPAEVGADRLVNALAAARLHGAPAVVVDFGTATTFDAVGPDGAFVGGAIAPGLELGLEALAARTAKLPRIELRVARSRDRPRHRVGDPGRRRPRLPAAGDGPARPDPARAGRADRTARGRDPVILTGGLTAAPWAAAIEGVDVIDPDLTLEGLAILHAEVGGGEPLALGLG